MGGERETKVASTPAVKARPAVTVGGPPPPPSPPTDQQVRIHENKGEVHFHVDAENLKVAVPVSVWFKAWERLESQPGETFSYVDKQRETMVTVKSGILAGTLDAEIKVERIANLQTGQTFCELQKFSQG